MEILFVKARYWKKNKKQMSIDGQMDKKIA